MLKIKEDKMQELEKLVFKKCKSTGGDIYFKELDLILQGLKNVHQENAKLKNELTELKQNTPNCGECKHLNKKIELNIKKKLMLENNQLEKELAELKEKAIVPKFSLKQTCFIICENDVMSAQIEKIIMKLSKDEEENSVFYSITNQYGYALRFQEEEIFGTKEEAEQKLAEIRGKDE